MGCPVILDTPFAIIKPESERWNKTKTSQQNKNKGGDLRNTQDAKSIRKETLWRRLPSAPSVSPSTSSRSRSSAPRPVLTRQARVLAPSMRNWLTRLPSICFADILLSPICCDGIAERPILICQLINACVIKFSHSVPPKSGYLSGTFLKSLALDFAIIRSGTGGESIEFPAFPHRTRSGLPVGETDGPRRGPSRQGFRRPAEALLLIGWNPWYSKDLSKRRSRKWSPLFCVLRRVGWILEWMPPPAPASQTAKSGY